MMKEPAKRMNDMRNLIINSKGKMNFIGILSIVTLAMSIIFFVLGLTNPILSNRIEIMGIGFSRKIVTVFDTILLFWETKDYLLAMVIGIFVVVLPVVKYIELVYRMIRNTYNRKYINLDRWNMLDVFLVALLLLNFKMNEFSIVMELRVGTAFIAAAVVTRIIAIILIDNLSIHKATSIE